MERVNSAAVASGVVSRYRTAVNWNALRDSTMTPTTLADSHVQTALRHGVHALKRLANSTLPAALERRLQQLGDNKEYLAPADREELLALVTFTHERTLEKLQAELALRELQLLLPDGGQP